MRSLLARVGLWERRRDERVAVHGWSCRTRNGSEQKWARIGDISPTGVYLLTNERWPQGASIRLSFHGRSFPNGDSRLELRLLAKCIRHTENGVGLAFERSYLDSAAWLKLMAKAACLSGRTDAVRLFCITKALAFLFYISPSAENQILKFITEVVNLERIDNATMIALRAEELMSSRNQIARTDVPSSVVMRILEEGAKDRDGEMQQCWAGLLASCALAGSEDDALVRFVSLLSMVDQFQMRILSAAWTRAMQVGWKSGFVFSDSIVSTAEEVRNIAGGRSLDMIERDLNNLHHLGLLRQTEKSCSIAQIECVNLTPTELGLKFYARCIGELRIPGSFDCAELDPASQVAELQKPSDRIPNRGRIGYGSAPLQQT